MISAILFSKPSRRSLEYGRLSGSLQTLSSVELGSGGHAGQQQHAGGEGSGDPAHRTSPFQGPGGEPPTPADLARRRGPFGDYSIANTCSEPPRVVALSRPAP